MESARIELSPGVGSSEPGWRITLQLEIGVVEVPGSYSAATVAEAVARDQVATLGFQVLGTRYGPSGIELQLRRVGSSRLGEGTPDRS